MTDLANISAHADPDGQAPWAMNIVVHIPTGDSPQRLDVCQAVAAGVVTYLEDARTRPERAVAVERWASGRIRKHVRRARGAKWDRARAVDGLTVTTDNIDVHIVTPAPVDETPSDIRKLQLTSSELDNTRSTSSSALVHITVNADAAMSWGKAAAACGHANQLLNMQLTAEQRQHWADDSYRCTVTEQTFDNLGGYDIAVTDAGFTEVEPGTVTATANWVGPT